MEVKIVECPRDAMQGISKFIPTELKTEYINALFQAGFDVLDFGSFVSPKAIPQMADTEDVVEDIDLSAGNTELLAIVANERGAQQACNYEEITFLGFPLSMSETFQQRNTNRSIAQAMQTVEEIQWISKKHQKKLVAYISMGFGNPYGDPYSRDTVAQFVSRLEKLGIEIISLSDTVGVAKPEDIDFLFKTLIPSFPLIEFGAHLHARPEAALEKLDAAYGAGCRRFDGALLGYGGCPMAEDKLIGNIDTLKIIDFLKSKGHKLKIDTDLIDYARDVAGRIFNKYQ